MKSNQRISWAVSVLAIKPTEHIWEIGCGAGILAEKIAPAIDYRDHYRD